MPTINMRVLGDSKRHQLVSEYQVSPMQAVEQTDYQIKTDGVPSSFKEDVRIVMKDILDYWVESQGSVWSKLPKLPINTPRFIYVVTGNPSATSASNGTNTFAAFDDFNDGVKTGWTENGGTWVESDGVMNQTSTTDASMQIYQNISSGTYIVEADVRPNAFNAAKDIGLVIRTNGLSGATEPHGHGFKIFYTDASKVSGLDQWVKWRGTVTAGFTFTAGSWYNFKMYAPLNDNTDMKGKAWLKGTTEPDWQVTYTMSSQTNKNVGIHGASNSGTTTTSSYDNFRVRKYASPEPIIQKLRTLNRSLLIKHLGIAG